MKKTMAKELDDFVKKVQWRYSQKEREGNINNELFNIKEIIPTSDSTACVMFKKSSGKLAAFFFYYIGSGASKGWRYFVPSDSHIQGMRGFEYYKFQTERFNYKHNFDEEVIK